ncbi:hypothetical protein [Paraburkholderia terrae]|uniref:hypothetical protein n=1 Tax=Paraburkholderia terrae TaxID=311230 RepID=UPI001EE35FF1|nr:hypothetical protein [Paraburkholderia terrae]GJH02285.1 hypothetical protein CBA19C8_17030 [Paraburkholderia terrae]
MTKQKVEGPDITARIDACALLGISVTGEVLREVLRIPLEELARAFEPGVLVEGRENWI